MTLNSIPDSSKALLDASFVPIAPLDVGIAPPRSSLLFIDPNVTDYQTLAAAAQPNTEVYLLDSGQDAIAQITQVLLGRSNLSSLHIVSHGQAGGLKLGSDWIDLQTLDRYSAQFQSWATALTEDADILLYGCNVAEGEIGRAFVQQLAKWTGAEIAASDDLTGKAELGGDWTLEVTTGNIETPVAFQALEYASTLASDSVVISQVYGAGGNANASYRNDFVELFNRSSASVNLNGWTIQYAVADASTWQSTALSGSIAPGGYYLVALASGGSTGLSLPTPNVTGTLNLNAIEGKVALVSNTTVLAGNNPAGAPGVVDLLGYGAANGFEGSPTSPLSATRAARRTAGNVDRDNNSADFTLVAPSPRNSSVSAIPQVTLASNPLSYTENAGLVTIDPTASLLDGDSTNFNGGTLTVNFTSGATSDDLLIIRSAGSITSPAGSIIAGVDVPGNNTILYKISAAQAIPIGTFTGGTKGNPLVISLNANSGPAAVQALMRSITYSNLSDNPTSNDRTVQFLLNDGTGWSGSATRTISLTTSNDAPVLAVPGATISLFNGSGTPNSQGFIYQALPNFPLDTVQNGNQLTTSNLDYVGFVAKPDLMPVLDRTTGYSIRFNVQIFSENHTGAGTDKNGDNIADRAGFSITVLGNDKKGIELGFWENEIWAQNDGLAEPTQVDPSGTLFTHGEGVAFDTKTSAINYELKIFGNTYSLFASGNQTAILTGNLRDYTNFATPSFLPSNPYTTPNFLFLGDSTPTASANFALGEISVNTGVTSSLAVNAMTDSVVSGISISDVDAGNSSVTATLSVSNGVLNVNPSVPNGVTSVTNNNSGTVTVIGTTSQINTTLAAAGLTYRSNQNLSGNDTLTVTVNDGGFSGSGGNRTDSKSFGIAVRALPTVSINNVSQSEGNSGATTFTFTVNLSEASTEIVTVNYASLDETATIADEDYLATSGTLTFAPGTTTQTISVTVYGDTKVESDEGFKITLSNVTNAAIANEIGIGTIRNDEQSPWKLAIAADLDNDNKADLLWRNSATGENIFWKMDGATLVSYASLSSVADLSWQIQGAADLDGDNKTDLLWRNTTTGENVFWKMDGTTLVSYATFPSVVDLTWQIQAIADLDNDNKADLLWRNTTTGENVFWKMDGTTLVSYATFPSVADSTWQIQGVADFDSDGKVDLLWRNMATGENLLWKMDGTTLVSYTTFPSIADLNWTIQATIDFDGDGQADLLWRNASTGELVLWKMDDLTLEDILPVNSI